MMMDDHSMDIDQVDSLQPMAGSSHSGRMSPYGLVPSIDDTNTRFSDLTPLERYVECITIINYCSPNPNKIYFLTQIC